MHISSPGFSLLMVGGGKNSLLSFLFLIAAGQECRKQ